MDDPIQFIKGVGPKKALLLEKLQLTSIEDFLYFLPFRYEDRRELKTISSLIPGQFATFVAEVLNSGIIFMGRRKRVYEVIFQDETGTTRAKFFRFNETYMLEKFKTGAKIIVSGKPTQSGKAKKAERQKAWNLEKSEIFFSSDVSTPHMCISSLGLSASGSKIKGARIRRKTSS